MNIYDTGDGLPPHSASTIGYILSYAFNYKWAGYEALKSIPNKQQVHRTLKELWHDGLIVGTRFKEDAICHGGLPCWVIRYQLSSQVEYNHMAAICDALHRKVHKAKHGVNFFGSIMDMGLPADEVAQLAIDVKRLIQQTHPDKASGYEYQLKQMIECRGWLKSGIPLPAPTHSTAQHQPKTGRLKNE